MSIFQALCVGLAIVFTNLTIVGANQIASSALPDNNQASAVTTAICIKTAKVDLRPANAAITWLTYYSLQAMDWCERFSDDYTLNKAI